MKRRPKIRPTRVGLDRFCESVAIFALIAGIVLIFQVWSGLPQTIPTHFDASGNPDGWGDKGMIWLLPAIGIVMIPLMLFLRRVPWLSNTPIKITEQNAEYQYGLIVRLLSILASIVSLLFFVLIWDTVAIAKGGNSLLGSLFMPIFMTAVFCPIIWYVTAAIRGR